MNTLLMSFCVGSTEVTATMERSSPEVVLTGLPSNVPGWSTMVSPFSNEEKTVIYDLRSMRPCGTPPASSSESMEPTSGASTADVPLSLPSLRTITPFGVPLWSLFTTAIYAAVLFAVSLSMTCVITRSKGRHGRGRLQACLDGYVSRTWGDRGRGLRRKPRIRRHVGREDSIWMRHMRHKLDSRIGDLVDGLTPWLELLNDWWYDRLSSLPSSGELTPAVSVPMTLEGIHASRPWARTGLRQHVG